MPTRPPTHPFRAEVAEVHDLSASMRRIVFSGPGLTDFPSTGCPDEYVRVLFPGPDQAEPELPSGVDAGVDLAAIDTGLLRTYTVRSVATGRVTIDMVLHDRGVATAWAKAATPGDVVILTSPTALYAAPSDLAWQVLVADAAGLPALARILTQTPATVRTRALIEVRGPAHQIDLPHHPNADITWIHAGNGVAASSLEDSLRKLQITAADTATGYIWVAGEARALRGIRRYLRQELALPATRFKAVGYWIERAEEWNQRYTNLKPAVRTEIESLWSQDRSEEDIEIEVDQRLTALGL